MKFQVMNHTLMFLAVLAMFSITLSSAHAEAVPDWIKNTAKWWIEGKITETEFLNAIKFLIEKNVIVIESKEIKPIATIANVVIPNGNSKVGNVGFYIPLNLAVKKETTVVWINDDNIQHTIQSQDEQGNMISLFNSNALKTGERFAHKFNEEGIYHYFCTIHPWRVGVVTVN